jgi:ATP-dependent RNA helicase RhlE
MPSVLIFTRTKQSARRLARSIASDGFAVGELHSNLTQPQRNRAMDGFRRGDFQVLVATNIAARGLDVNHITHVISFDVPAVPDDYIHRIGRTARMEAEGDAFVLVAPAEEASLARIERQMGQRLPRVLLPDFDYATALTERAGKPHHGSHGRRALKSHREVTHTPRTSGTSSPSSKEPLGADSPPGPSRRFRRRR